MEELEQSIRQKLEVRLRSCDNLPSLPAVAIRLVAMCRKDEVDLKKLAEVISNDPALSAKVLKVVNSPFYGLRAQVTTISHASALLGMDAVRTLALSFSLLARLQTRRRHGFDYYSYWKRCVLSAISARETARSLGLDNPEELFLGGLLQDLGMMVFNEALPGGYGRLYRAAGRSHENLVTLEQENLGIDHAEAGSLVVREWGLPEILQSAIEWSHDPASFEGSEGVKKSVACVALSGSIADIWLEESVEDALVRASARADSLLSIDSHRLEKILAWVAESTPHVSSLFEISFGTVQEIYEVLEEARQLLIRLNLQVLEGSIEHQGRVDRLTGENEVLKERLEKDPLTGVANRTAFKSFSETAFRRSAESGKPLSLLFVDIDRFKMTNDRFGHPTGDAVLVSVAHTLVSGLRQGDMVARYGGDEFVVLLPGADSQVARSIADRLCSSVAEAEHHDTEGGLIDITLSIGCATHDAQQSFEGVDDLVSAADAAMYEAKKQGRNNVCSYEGPPGQPLTG